MKKKGHPPYQEILFVDTAANYQFVCGSTLQPKETEVFEGKEYPVYRVPISSASHPFFTQSHQFVDTEGRVSKFRKRYARQLNPKADELSDADKAPTTAKQAQEAKKKEVTKKDKKSPQKKTRSATKKK